MQRRIFSTALLAAGLFAFAARAEMVPFHATLNAASEVPPKNSKASGEVTAELDTTTKTLTWTLTYSGLTGPAVAAHFHGPAAPGANAGIAVPIPDIKSGSKGSAKLTDAQIADLQAGKWYVNVHTQANPGGEIRGQVLRQGM
jgi:hypothetical protein